MKKRPRFSIISPDYDQWVPRGLVERGITSLASQEFKNFEWLIVHDGPKQVSYDQEFDLGKHGMRIQIVEIQERMGQWGFPAREIAMRKASGEVFIHMNIDNILYPNALGVIDKHLRMSNKPIATFEIWHHKLGIHLTGIPPINSRIDMLQFVAAREVWESINFEFVGKEQYSCDGITIEHILSVWQDSLVHIPEKLGENF